MTGFLLELVHFSAVIGVVVFLVSAAFYKIWKGKLHG